ncbi:hypothetical protein F5Y15DRAFT_299803 [Xylariaceae sp. FL0016]|nr:hypothetical protein F5Y15DRAFT_299803 [Xylariaceae sp. FL0016]
MAASRAARLQVGSSPWIAEERSSAMQIAQSEVEEFTFSARNDFDWLNEHMAEVFSENQINVAEVFKTPGRLRGKTPRTTRKLNGENRVPLADIFSATPKGAPSPFSMPNYGRNNASKVKIAVDPLPQAPQTLAPRSPLKQVASPKHPSSKQIESAIDSGYHGSQDTMEAEEDSEPTHAFSPQGTTHNEHLAFQAQAQTSPIRTSPEPTVDNLASDADTQYFTAHIAKEASSKKAGHQFSTTPAGSPAPRPVSASPTAYPVTSHTLDAEPLIADPDAMETVFEEPSGSPSDGSSPIRPPIRKSSLNLASLPAREPMTHKSTGNRISRTSHLDQNRTSYYNRPTGGKSLGNTRHELTDDENDEMDIDEDTIHQKPQSQVHPEDAVTHNKTYTQRLQDQINKLGQTQANVAQSSKSISGDSVAQQSTTAVPAPQPTPKKHFSPPKKTVTTPGAFPEDEDDDWIEPLGQPDGASSMFSPRPTFPKSYSADVMEGVSGKQTVSDNDFAVPKTRKSKSPHRPAVPERTASKLGHHKSMSVPTLPMVTQNEEDENDLKKTISVSNPALATVNETESPNTPKSPTRGFSNSPLKQVKNKLSSILKSSKGLLASSAALSAEGKSSLLSPSSTRLGFHLAPSTETLGSPLSKDFQPMYPDLSRHAVDNQTVTSTSSPTRTASKRTRASVEREKAEERRKKEEAKEARRAAEQMDKLEKAREKEREKARVFSKEQERIAAMEKQLAAQKEQERKAAIATPSTAKATRTSPRRGKPPPAAEVPKTDIVPDDKTEDVEMIDAPSTMPPPSTRSAAPPSAQKGREIKRPMRPVKEPSNKAKQAPTVIRVNMGSQHSQYHQTNNTLASSFHESLSQPQTKSKVSQPPLQSKPSLQSLKSSTSSTGRPKALEAAARRKEQEEREAQRKRDAKAEMERRRAAAQEEEKRQEQQRKLEAERQKEEERKQAIAQAEAKKNAQRQAMLEKAKQTRAPPPPVRNQPNGPPDYARADPSRPPSRMNPTAPVNTTLAKSTSKRPLQESNEEPSRQTQPRGAQAYQPKEGKRMRMTDELNDNPEKEKQPSLKGAPVRPSGGLKKDMSNKSMFPTGYANASQTGNRDLFKSTLTNQHAGQIKAAHPLDMAQVSKTAIPFAPNPNPAGPSHKTPARPHGVAATKSAAKSATRSSPRFQNGEAIELPEINTDDEDSDEEDAAKGMVADWADSPNLRRALVEQETMDPFAVFGAPGPINMEEVFSKSKDRFPKFRNRTSSANWSGADRLTEDDIRKDLAAREKMRREGGWTYETSRDMV